MPKRSSKGPRNPDENETAFRIVQEATRGDDEKEPAKPEPPAEKNPAAVALGRLGGLKGGKARAEKLSKEKKSEIAREAAKARWRKEKGD